MMASVNSVSQMANPAARRQRPSQPAVFSNDAAPIAATHSRPVQYSQDHAYGQEASTPPVPSSPRGRGLVEPYRPLGPLPPRTARAVARLGPHPVADCHPIDVTALAAPPHHGACVGVAPRRAGRHSDRGGAAWRRPASLTRGRCYPWRDNAPFPHGTTGTCGSPCESPAGSRATAEEAQQQTQPRPGHRQALRENGRRTRPRSAHAPRLRAHRRSLGKMQYRSRETLRLTQCYSLAEPEGCSSI